MFRTFICTDQWYEENVLCSAGGANDVILLFTPIGLTLHDINLHTGQTFPSAENSFLWKLCNCFISILRHVLLTISAL